MKTLKVLRRRGSHILSKQSGSLMTVRLSTLPAGRPLPTRKIPGSHFSQRLSRPRAIVRLQRLGKLKKIIIHFIGTRSHYLLACSIVPQPNTLQRVPWTQNCGKENFSVYLGYSINTWIERLRKITKLSWRLEHDQTLNGYFPDRHQMRLGWITLSVSWVNGVLVYVIQICPKSCRLKWKHT
jgi:hypothetical protein